jgi:hypothetical protein
MRNKKPAFIRRLILQCIFLILFLAVHTHSQSLGISPYSFKAIGGIHSTSEIFFLYEQFGIHYFHTWDHNQFQTEEDKIITQKSSSLAVSFTPVRLTYFNAGAIYFKNRFPVTIGNRLHFMLALSLPLDRLTISYKHISNGFGLIYELNPGIDTISLQYKF